MFWGGRGSYKSEATYTLILIRKEFCFVWPWNFVFMLAHDRILISGIIKDRCALQKSESLKTALRRPKPSPSSPGAQVWFVNPKAFGTYFIFFTCSLQHPGSASFCLPSPSSRIYNLHVAFDWNFLPRSLLTLCIPPLLSFPRVLVRSGSTKRWRQKTMGWWAEGKKAGGNRRRIKGNSLLRKQKRKESSREER